MISIINSNDKHHNLHSRTSIIYISLFKIEAVISYKTLVNTYCSVWYLETWKIISKYSNKKQRFLIDLFLQTLYMFKAVPPPIIRSTQLYIQLQVLSTDTAASCYRGRDGCAISSTVAASSSIGWQYLKLYVQLCAPDDGRRNRLKHVQRL